MVTSKSKGKKGIMQTAAFKITPPIKRELVKIIDARIKEAHVTKEDFSELKNIVKDLGIKVGELAEAQKELAGAQKRTEGKVEELIEAQKRTEIEIKALTGAIKELHGEIGGLGRSAGYALENEAYRHLPELLQGKYGIVVKEKMIRSQIGGKEINVFGRAARDGQEVLVVGEARTRLDERRGAEEAFEELEEKVQAVTAEYGQVEIVKILVTHFARKGFLDLAKERGIIVVQSFEW
jgi:hypothetical protein